MALVEGVGYWNYITSPNTKFTHQWTTNLVVSEEVAEDFRNKGFKVKEMDEGPALVITRKTLNKDGKPNDVPILIDKDRKPLDCGVGNGSKVVVQYTPWETTNQYGHFKGMDLCGMQVLDLVEYSPAVPDGAELGYVAAEEVETSDDMDVL